MSLADLTINGMRLPYASAGEIEQSYEDIGGFSVRRLGGGALIHQETWRRVRTVLTAAGWTPPGLSGIDWSQSFALGCVAPRRKKSATNVIGIPAARRTDVPPVGFAILSDGSLLQTGIAVAANVATLTVVPGAIGYEVQWHPLMTVRAPDGVRESYDAQGAVASWELVCEEV